MNDILQYKVLSNLGINAFGDVERRAQMENEDKERYQELEEQLNGALASLSKSNGNLNEWLVNDTQLDKEDETDAVEGMNTKRCMNDLLAFNTVNEATTFLRKYGTVPLNLAINDNEDKERYQELEEQLNRALASLSKSNGILGLYS